MDFLPVRYDVKLLHKRVIRVVLDDDLLQAIVQSVLLLCDTTSTSCMRTVIVLDWLYYLLVH